MRISELSTASGVTIASIKYYLREGLLAPGVATATNQAEYGDTHVDRLRLVRSLIDVGGLPIANVRAILAAVDDESTTLHDAFGSVMHSLGSPHPQIRDPELDAALREVGVWIAGRGWEIKPEAPAVPSLAALVVTLRRFDFPIEIKMLDGMADIADANAADEVAYARAMSDRTTSVETMVIGTLVFERIQAEVRRLALEAASARLDGSTKARRGSTRHRPRKGA